MKKTLALALVVAAALPALYSPAQARRISHFRVFRHARTITHARTFSNARTLVGSVSNELSAPARPFLTWADRNLYNGMTLNPTVGTYGPAYTGNAYPELILHRREWYGYFGNRWY